jgi:glutamyl-tRNA(Gln) amidotransferase subunit E
LKFLHQQNIELDLAKVMLPPAYEHPQMDFDSILSIIKFKRISKSDIESKITFLNEKFLQSAYDKENDDARVRWVMGQLHKIALGNVSMKELEIAVRNSIN